MFSSCRPLRLRKTMHVLSQLAKSLQRKNIQPQSRGKAFVLLTGSLANHYSFLAAAAARLPSAEDVNHALYSPFQAVNH